MTVLFCKLKVLKIQRKREKKNMLQFVLLLVQKNVVQLCTTKTETSSTSFCPTLSGLSLEEATKCH